MSRKAAGPTTPEDLAAASSSNSEEAAAAVASQEEEEEGRAERSRGASSSASPAPSPSKPRHQQQPASEGPVESMDPGARRQEVERAVGAARQAEDALNAAARAAIQGRREPHPTDSAASGRLHWISSFCRWIPVQVQDRAAHRRCVQVPHEQSPVSGCI